MELVCYDLRSDAKHEITVAIARDTQAAQDAVDRELVSRYRPGQKREGLLVQLVERIHHLQNIATRSRHDLPVQLSAVPERVTFPFDIWRLVDVRWQELGYPSFSAYITGLIRYDLLVGGPHSSTTADPPIETATQTHPKNTCGPSQRRPSQNSAGSLDRGSRRTPGAAGRDATSESANRKGAARHLVYALSASSYFGTSNSSSNATDNDLPPRSEHSQGGAQRSEQYLYGAQRAIN